MGDAKEAHRAALWEALGEGESSPRRCHLASDWWGGRPRMGDSNNENPESKGKDKGEEKYNVSQIFWCGPEYDSERHCKKNQILRVCRFTTDLPFLAAISCYFVFMIMVWSFAAEKEQYHHLANGMDWRGQACGVGDLTTSPKQAWVNHLMSDIWTGAVCVPECQTLSPLH